MHACHATDRTLSLNPHCAVLARQILVLDEVTSALDVTSEAAISDTLRQLSTTTKLIIAHRRVGAVSGGHA